MALSLAPACSASLPKPPSGRVPDDAWIDVPYPPPPARVEVIPKEKSPDDVWVDGQWDWDGKDWRWIAGAWVTPPKGAYFTRWAAGRRPDGQLMFARGTWRTADGRPFDPSGGCPLPEPSARGGKVAGR